MSKTLRRNKQHKQENLFKINPDKKKNIYFMFVFAMQKKMSECFIKKEKIL